MAEEEELKPKSKPHYVDNKKFLEAMIEYRKERLEAEAKGLKRQEVV